MGVPRGFSRPAWLAVAAVFVLTAAVGAQPPSFRVHIENTIAVFGNGVITVDVNCANSLDSVGGFKFWFQLDRPDLGEFQLTTIQVVDTTYWKCTGWDQTTCIDSVIADASDYDFIHINSYTVQGGGVDTTGTMIGGWEWVDDRSLSGIGYDLLVTGVADWPPYGDGAPPIPPGDSGVMFRLRLSVPDTPPPPVVEPPYIAHIIQNTQFVDNLELFDPLGNSLILGLWPDCDTTIDTTFFRCDAWMGDQCLNWSIVSAPPYDSIFVDTVVYPCIDTTRFTTESGSVRLLLCGDFNGDDQVNISDLTDLVGYLFGGLPPDPGGYWIAMDFDGDGTLNIAELTYFVAYLFSGGAHPLCP